MIKQSFNEGEEYVRHLGRCYVDSFYDEFMQRYALIKPDEVEAQDALLCVQTGKLITEVNRLRMIDTPNLYLKSPDEMAELFIDCPEALENTVKIANKCKIEIELVKAVYPSFKTPNDKSPMQYLREITRNTSNFIVLFAYPVHG